MRTAIVTGAGRGIGRALTLALAMDDFRVAAVARTAAQVEETVSLVRSRGGEAVSILADVTDEEAVSKMVETAEAQLGPVDLLVNNAGAGAPFGPTWETNRAEWWRNIETNLKGPYLCCHTVMPGMIERSAGRIVNVASGAGTVSIPHMSAYVTGKCALIRFTEVLADEAREHGVSVFTIQPGTVRTEMTEEVLQSESGARWLPWFGTIFKKGQDVSADPACELVRFLASGQADELSGRMFIASGDPSEIMRHAEEIRANNLHVLRMSTYQP